MKYINGPMGFFAPCDTYVRWDDYASLAAENERLRKAGDAMYRYVGKSPEHSIQMDKHDKSKRDWLAAKEGGRK